MCERLPLQRAKQQLISRALWRSSALKRLKTIILRYSSLCAKIARHKNGKSIVLSALRLSRRLKCDGPLIRMDLAESRTLRSRSTSGQLSSSHRAAFDLRSIVSVRKNLCQLYLSFREIVHSRKIEN